jgi:hypothetical protein
LQSQVVEPERSGGNRSLGRIAAAPAVIGQPPADLDARLYMLKRWITEIEWALADESRKRNFSYHFDRPQSPAIHFQMFASPRRFFVALLAREGKREELPDTRIGVESSKGWKIIVPPLAQQ